MASSLRAPVTAQSLFSLPLEIREIIYSYLTPPSRLPTVLRSRRLGVSSVSHRPPPLAFLLTCRQLYTEALDLYYRRCVFKLEGLIDPGNVWPLWQVEEVLATSEVGKAALGHIRKVELSLFWHRLPDGGIARTALANVGGEYGSGCKTEVDKRVERMESVVDVLMNAARLSVVIVTWKEIPARQGEEQSDWAANTSVLKPLERLGGVRILPGDILASDDIAHDVLLCVKTLDKTTSSLKRRCHVLGCSVGYQRTEITLPEKSGQYLCTPEDSVCQKLSYFE